jgi:hypothetical protein
MALACFRPLSQTPTASGADAATSASHKLLERGLRRSVTYTLFDALWVPSAARFVTLGQHARGTGAIEVFSLEKGECLFSVSRIGFLFSVCASWTSCIRLRIFRGGATIENALPHLQNFCTTSSENVNGLQVMVGGSGSPCVMDWTFATSNIFSWCSSYGIADGACACARFFCAMPTFH